jgi:HlyD family secretion protein
LELQGGVNEIKAPTNGVVQEIHVKDGEAVEQGEPLATFKPTLPKADLESLKQQKEALIRQNQIYENALKRGNPKSAQELLR